MKRAKAACLLFTAANAFAPLSTQQIARVLEKRADAVVAEVEASGLCVVDGLLGAETCAAMRAEALALYDGGALAASTSKSFDVAFEKKGVVATGLAVGDGDEPSAARPAAPPLLSAYLAALGEVFGARAGLAAHARNNKLAATTVGGGYPLHLDNDGGDARDRRRLTCIYYLQDSWTPDEGGEFFAVGAGWDFERRKVEPVGDRLVAFDARSFFHSVDPVVGDGTRLALTLWLEDDDG